MTFEKNIENISTVGKNFGKRRFRFRVTFGLTTSLIGLLIFILGARPTIYGLDFSPIIGYVQIAVFLVGLGIICIGGYVSLIALWRNTHPSILADFGSRMVATGYVICVFCGMADVFGFGSHPIQRPYFGWLQAWGVIIGQIIIGVGLLMMIPYRPLKNGK